MNGIRFLIIVLFTCVASLYFSVSCAREKSGVFHVMREKMVREQIEARGVRDAGVLFAMGKVQRELFVPKYLRSEAYDDSPLPIGKSQTISQPYIVAFMTEALHLRGGERVLEIGTGSGYQTAVLAELAGEVYTVEIICEFSNTAKKQLADMRYKNIHCICANGYEGWNEHAPYDAIIVTAAPGYIPKKLVEQLKIGGRMVIPVGRGSQYLILITKTKTGMEKENLLPVRFVPMTGEP